MNLPQNIQSFFLVRALIPHLYVCMYRQSPVKTPDEIDIKECFTEVKQVFLLYLWDSLVTLELISLIPLVGPPFMDPLAVKLLDNRLYI